MPVLFYRTASGVELVRDWLRGLSADDKRRLGADLATVQIGWPVGMPLCRAMGAGLWEVRTDLSGHRTARILFFVWNGRIGVLHGFIKKTRATPPEDIALARKRMAEMKS